MKSATRTTRTSNLTGYHLEKSSHFACKADQRLSYCTYVPRSYTPDSVNEMDLVVLAHGSDRNNQEIRDYFIHYAEQNNCVILAPLFPCGLIDPDDTDNYKYLKFKDIRFDQILLSMVDEISERYGISWPRFKLFGFSGGAQFAHRFFLVHPEKLDCIVVASPGAVTLIDDTASWWIGTAGIEDALSFRLNIEAMKAVKIHLCVGADDIQRHTSIVQGPDGPMSPDSANYAGKNRNERLLALYDNYLQNGLDASFSIIPDTGHECFPACDEAIRFFTKHA